MIWQVWVTLVLVGTVWAYFALIPKKAAPFAALAMVGHFAVAGFGALSMETRVSMRTEAGAAILCLMLAIIGVVVFIAAVTGQLQEGDLDTPGAGEVRDHLEES